MRLCRKKVTHTDIIIASILEQQPAQAKTLNVNLRIDHNIWKTANPYQREEVVAWGAMVQQGREEGGKRMGSLALLILDLLP